MQYRIFSKNVNVLRSADDILMATITPRGVQMLIDVSNQQVTSHDLRYNSHLAKCTSLGKQYIC